jgi:hypothetical protein
MYSFFRAASNSNEEAAACQSILSGNSNLQVFVEAFVRHDPKNDAEFAQKSLRAWNTLLQKFNAISSKTENKTRINEAINFAKEMYSRCQDHLTNIKDHSLVKSYNTKFNKVKTEVTKNNKGMDETTVKVVTAMRVVFESTACKDVEFAISKLNDVFKEIKNLALINESIRSAAATISSSSTQPLHSCDYILKNIRDKAQAFRVVCGSDLYFVFDEATADLNAKPPAPSGDTSRIKGNLHTNNTNINSLPNSSVPNVINQRRGNSQRDRILQDIDNFISENFKQDAAIIRDSFHELLTLKNGESLMSLFNDGLSVNKIMGCIFVRSTDSTIFLRRANAFIQFAAPGIRIMKEFAKSETTSADAFCNMISRLLEATFLKKDNEKVFFDLISLLCSGQDDPEVADDLANKISKKANSLKNDHAINGKYVNFVKPFAAAANRVKDVREAEQKAKNDSNSINKYGTALNNFYNNATANAENNYQTAIGNGLNILKSGNDSDYIVDRMVNAFGLNDTLSPEDMELLSGRE